MGGTITLAVRTHQWDGYIKPQLGGGKRVSKRPGTALLSARRPTGIGRAVSGDRRGSAPVSGSARGAGLPVPHAAWEPWIEQKREDEGGEEDEEGV